MPRRKKADQTLRLPERFTVEAVADVMAELRARTVANVQIRVDLSAVAAIDTAALQLLAAASRDADGEGRAIAFESVPDTVADCARLLGLQRFLGLD